VLWKIGLTGEARPPVLKDPRHAGQNWVPAFAGMSGFEDAGPRPCGFL